jgi:hypothetical protein
LRSGRQISVPVGYAFTTESDVTCLVPAGRLTLMGRAARAISGEQVRIRGTITGNQDSHACVLVDYIGFPAQMAAEDGKAWLVTIEWPGAGPWIIWDYGYWSRRLPCQHQRGATELLQVLLTQYRQVELRLPPRPPAPEPEEEPEEAEEEVAPSEEPAPPVEAEEAAPEEGEAE